MNKKIFFDTVKPIFGGLFNHAQVDGLDAILDEFLCRVLAIDAMAYMLATAFHETAHTMQPVRETLADSDDKAITILDRAFARGQLKWVKKPYWRKDADGKSWLGRGLVQLTHKVNYQKMSAITGIDLVAHPERAMEMDVAIAIMIEGMTHGIFTGKDNDDFLDGVDESDAEDFREFVSARRIINGTDRAADIARIALTFEKALRAAGA